MTDYEKVVAYLRQECEQIRGEWNGDEAGKQEYRADQATELLELLDKVDELMKELDI